MKLDRKPLDWSKDDPANPRQLPRRDEDLAPDVRDALLRLGESLRVKQLQPIVCLPDGTRLAGNRRHRAAKLVGLPSLDVLIVEERFTESQLRALAFAENVHRTDLSPWEQFVAVRDLAAINPGKPFKDLAAMLNLTPARITQIMAPAKCVAAVQEAFRLGGLSSEAVITLSQATQEEQPTLLERLKAGVKLGEVKRQVKSKREEGKPTAKSGRIRVPLPGNTIVTVVGEEMSLEQAIEKLSDAVKLAKAALAKGITAKSAQSVWADLAAAAG